MPGTVLQGIALLNIRTAEAELTQFPDSPGMLCLWCLVGSMNAPPELCGVLRTLHHHCSCQVAFIVQFVEGFVIVFVF